MKVKFGSLLKGAFVFFTALLMIACSNTDNSDNSEPGVVTISGRIIDGITRSAINNLTVSLKINGVWKSGRSGTPNSGDFAFSNLPEGSDFFMEITDKNGVYASKYLIGKTTSRTVADQDKFSQDLGVFEIFEEATVNVTLKNAKDDSALSGLTLYYNPIEELHDANPNLISNAISDVVALEPDSDGVYQVKLPNDGKAQAVYLASQQIEGIDYEPLGFTIGADKKLTEVTAGTNKTLFFVPEDHDQFKVIFHLVDESGADVEIPNSVLPIDSNGNTIYAEKSADVTNQYELMLTVNDTVGGNFNLTMQNIDVDGDGFIDTAAQHLVMNAAQFQLDNDSFSGETVQSLTQPVIISSISNAQDINVAILSDPNDFQAGVEGKLILGFDRPVQLIHTATASYSDLSETSPEVALNSPANVYDNSDGTSFLEALTPTAGQYSYTDNTPATQQSASLGDSSNNLSSPFETMYSTTENIVAVTTTFRANNTILELEIDPTLLNANHKYKFVAALEGMLIDTPRLVVERTVTALASTTLTALTDLTVDDANFKDTTTRDLTDATKEQYFSWATPHAAQLFSPLADHNLASAPDNIAYVNYVNYQSVNSVTNPSTLAGGSLYIISPVMLEGTAEVTSYTESYLEAAVAKTISHTPNDNSMIFGLGYQSDSDIAQVIGNTYSGEITNATSGTYYVLLKPNNHYIDQGANITTVYNAGSDLAGINVATEGVYYVYTIPALATSFGGYVSDVTLDLNVKGGNGSYVTGSQTFNIQ